MDSRPKIPTILGLGILLLGLGVGVFMSDQNQTLKLKASQSAVPKDITVTNVSATRASIFWQTDIPTTGFVQTGNTSLLSEIYRDERDVQGLNNYRLHFVTLTNLRPNSTYYYKINSGPLVFPQSQSLSFKTLPESQPLNYQPIIGTIVNSSLQPVPEAVVTLEIPGAKKLITITKVAGNFLLPLSNLNPLQPEEAIDGRPDLKAKLIISDGNTSSEISINPFSKQLVLPPLVLGQNKDLTTVLITPTPTPVNFDINNDGTINSLDRSIVLKNISKKPMDKLSDLNKDGVVDQQDLELIDKVTRR